MTPLRRTALIGLITIMTTAPRLSADEGMWVFNNLPLGQLKEKYGFAVSDAWVE